MIYMVLIFLRNIYNEQVNKKKFTNIYRGMNSNEDSDVCYSDSEDGCSPRPLLERSSAKKFPKDYDKYGIYNPEKDPWAIWDIDIEREDRQIMILFAEFHNFITKLKIEIAMGEINLPDDLYYKILSETLKNDTSYMLQVDIKARLLNEYDQFINRELRNRLERLEIPYDEDDIFVNVVNYAKAKKIDLSNQDIIKKEVSPWLGSTNYELISETTIHNRALRQYFGQDPNDVLGDEHIIKIIKTNKRLYGGMKFYKKKSRRIAKIRKNSKINKKIDKS